MEKPEIQLKPFSKDRIKIPDERTVLVALEYPSPFNRLVSAIEYVNLYLQPSFENPAKIKVAPGIYQEVALASVNIAAGTVIEGASAFATQIFLLTPQLADPFLIVNGYAEIRDIQLTGGRFENKNGSDPSYPIIGPTPPNAENTLIYMSAIPLNALVVSNCGFSGAKIIIQCDAPGGIIGFSGAWGIFSTPFITTDANPNNWLYLTFDVGIFINAAARVVLTGTGSFTNDVITQGLIFVDPRFQPQFFDYGLHVTNSGILDMTGVSIEAGTVGIRSDGAESVHIVGGSFLNNITHIEVANTTNFSVYSLQTVNNVFLNFVVNDFVIEDSTSQVVSIGSNYDSSKIVLPSDVSNIIIQYSDYNIDNERGFHNIGNFISGAPLFPSESYFGGGATDTSSLVALKFDSIGVTYTDVSSQILPSGTTVTLFDDLVGGHFYVGVDYQFSGFNMIINTIIDLGSGTLVIEYYDSVAVDWVEFNQMSSQHSIPHTSYANALFSVAEIQDIRFDANIDQAQVAVNSITKYWIRFRITSTITTSPVISSLKPYTNLTLATTTGFLLYYGKARPKASIPFDFSFVDAQGVTAPFDATLFVSKELFLNRKFNSFAGGDEATIGFYVPPTLDSSTAIEMVFSFISDGTLTTDFEFLIRYGCFGENQLLYLTANAAPASPVAGEKSLTVFLTPNDNAVVSETIQLDVSDCVASVGGEISQIFILKLERITNANTDRTIFTNLGFYQTIYINGLSQQ